MAIAAADSIETSPKFPREKLQRETPLKNRYAETRKRLGNLSAKISQSFKGLISKKPQELDIAGEQRQMTSLTQQLKVLEQKTEKQLATGSEQLAKMDYSPFSEESVQYFFEIPDRQTYTTLIFESKRAGGDELDPGKRIIYRIPDEYRGRVIRDVVLKHRKDPHRFSGQGWDPNGAYSRVMVKDTESGDWKSWTDPAEYSSDKFAEPRPANDPENEVLHDWITTVGEVRPSIISVENVGQGELAVSNVHGLEVVFFPETAGVSYQQTIFSSGTEFVDIEKDRKEPRFGGGPAYHGKYPDALALGSWYKEGKGSEIVNDSTLYTDEQGRLHVKLIQGKKFISLELAVGDTHPDGVLNKDGHVGTLGWAKIYAGTKGADETINYFMNNVNVPPAGVLAGGPEQADHIVQNGEELIVESRADTTYLMGLRIAYRD